MNINEVEKVYSDLLKLINDFKSLNNRISGLKSNLGSVSGFETDVTGRVNDIYHSLEVEDYSASQKSKIMKILQSSLRERRAAKMCREYLEAVISEFENCDIKYKPLANDMIGKAVGKVTFKHNGIASKSKESVKSVKKLISEHGND